MWSVLTTQCRSRRDLQSWIKLEYSRENREFKFVIQLCANLESTWRLIYLYPLFQENFKPSRIAHSSAIMLWVIPMLIENPPIHFPQWSRIIPPAPAWPIFPFALPLVLRVRKGKWVGFHPTNVVMVVGCWSLGCMLKQKNSVAWCIPILRSWDRVIYLLLKTRELRLNQMDHKMNGKIMYQGILFTATFVWIFVLHHLWIGVSKKFGVGW